MSDSNAVQKTVRKHTVDAVVQYAHVEADSQLFGPLEVSKIQFLCKFPVCSTPCADDRLFVSERQGMGGGSWRFFEFPCFAQFSHCQLSQWSDGRGVENCFDQKHQHISLILFFFFAFTHRNLGQYQLLQEHIPLRRRTDNQWLLNVIFLTSTAQDVHVCY